MTTTIRHVLSEAERITMLRTGELVVATAEHENLQAATQQNDHAAAAMRNPALAIEDAFPAIVADGTIPTATTAQAFHPPIDDVSVDVAATPPAIAAATIHTATTLIARGQQILAACASPFGIGQGGIVPLTESNGRARDMARRTKDAVAAKAASEGAANDRLRASRARPSMRPKKL